MIILWTIYICGFILVERVNSVFGQSTTASYLQSQTYLDQMKYPRSKYYYFFTPRSQLRELIEPTGEETLLEDRGYESYEGHQAQWSPMPSKVIHQQPIHVHHTVPYHKENNEKNYVLPILLLALLPLLIGALLLLPLLFSFLTNVLQLLALMQQTIQNLQNNGTGRRRRSDRHINPIILSTISTLVDKFIASQQNFGNLSSN